MEHELGSEKDDDDGGELEDGADAQTKKFTWEEAEFYRMCQDMLSKFSEMPFSKVEYTRRCRNDKPITGGRP
ncbi:hypothetical protein AVEN_130499-1 [Araneus ventricosus]|uniref:Uncharacterized protein n=1 Tax=Araneus ventricosus TaxID=182803 RepID=A0A4Y2EI31_ARAVE|nr:hypothetical protein AVEN_130499-1 [Araneus ventricosus]